MGRSLKSPNFGEVGRVTLGDAVGMAALPGLRDRASRRERDGRKFDCKLQNEHCEWGHWLNATSFVAERREPSGFAVRIFTHRAACAAPLTLQSQAMMKVDGIGHWLGTGGCR